VLQNPFAARLLALHRRDADRLRRQEQSAGSAAAPSTAPAPSAPMPDAAPTHARRAGGERRLAGIAKAEGGRTVAEVFRGEAELAGQEVLVRGRS